jgi:hypothetical protein
MHPNCQQNENISDNFRTQMGSSPGSDSNGTGLSIFLNIVSDAESVEKRCDVGLVKGMLSVAFLWP